MDRLWIVRHDGPDLRRHRIASRGDHPEQRVAFGEDADQPRTLDDHDCALAFRFHALRDFGDRHVARHGERRLVGYKGAQVSKRHGHPPHVAGERRAWAQRHIIAHSHRCDCALTHVRETSMGHAEFTLSDRSKAKPISLDEYWMPFTPNREFKADPKLVVRAEGMYYWNDRGEKIIDAAAGLFCCAAGHGRREISEAVGKQLAE